MGAASAPWQVGLGEGVVRQFRWFPAGQVPAAYDLRRLGWRLLDEGDAAPDPALPLLGRPRALPLSQWLELAASSAGERKWTMLLDIPDSAERTRMLRMGFGDALDYGTSLEELEYRVQRLSHLAQSLPRFRDHGEIRIDLLARDAFVAGRRLGLHPREFAVLWRLTDTPGDPVSPRELLRDVWRLAFRPETNSLAVHVSRLRAKLRLAGFDNLIETMPDGAYRLVPQGRALFGTGVDLALDGYLRIGKETPFAASRA